MILITGAGGKTGAAVRESLIKRGGETRSFLRNASKSSEIGEYVIGDLLNQDDINRAMKGANQVYHICPNVHPKEIEIGEKVIQAAKANSVDHFIFHSVLHAQIEAMPHHWNKMRVEEKLFASGLNYTILQPASYMQNILNSWTQIIEESSFKVPYSLNAKFSMVDLQDVAEAAALVIGNSVHYGATYELCGPEDLDNLSVANILSEVLGNKITAMQISIEEWESAALRSGLGDYPINTLSKMFDYYNKFGFTGNPNTLVNIIGREPNTFRDFLNEIAV